MNFPENLKYTKDHEWVLVEDNLVTIGITEFAQGELGDIVFVEIETQGETLAKDDTFGTVEAVKTVSELYMPLAGVVEEINPNLEDSPETVNSDPYGDGWMIKIKTDDLSEIENLMDAAAYKEMLGE